MKRETISKIKSYIYAIIMMLGIFCVIGTVGSIELDSITFKQAFSQSTIGFAMMFIGAFGVNLEEGRRKNSRRYRENE